MKLIPAPLKNRDSMLVSTRTPRSVNSRAANAASVMSGWAARTANTQARCGSTFEGRCPPVPALRRSPVRWKRCSHLIAAAALTPNRRAAARRLSPPLSTASITRSRKSCAYARAIAALLPPRSACAASLGYGKDPDDSSYSHKALGSGLITGVV